MQDKVIFVDIDDTICYYEGGSDKSKPLEYNKAIPDYRKIAILNKLYDDGNDITMWTARGSITGLDHYDLTKKQLDSWGVKYHRLQMGKPFFHLLIDDRALSSLDDIKN